MALERWQQLGIAIVAIVLMVFAMTMLVSTYAVSGEFSPQPGPAIHPMTSVGLWLG